FWTSQSGSNRGQVIKIHFYSGGDSPMHVQHAPLFVFASFGCVIWQRAVRVSSECNTRASSGQRAIRAAYACSMRASTRASVSADAHAFSCRSLRNSTETGGRSSQVLCRTKRIISFWLADLFRNDASARHTTIFT